MKILIIRTTANHVDLKDSTYNQQEIGLARAFNQKGHICDVVYYGGNESKTVKINYDKNNSFNAYYIKAKNFLKNGIYSKELYSLIKNYDIVHSGGYDQLESWILAKKIPQKLVIYNGTYFSDFNTRYNKKCMVFDRLFLPRYIKNDIYFDTKSKLSAKFLIDRGIKNVTPIGVGIDLEQLQIKNMIPSELSYTIESEKSKGIKFITYIGRIEPRRNTEFLIECFKAIATENEKIKLLIVGRGEKEYKNKCFEKIKEYNLEERVIYREKLSQELLPKIYSLSDIFLLPTRYEIFGMVLLEAMYFETPVITTYNGGSDMLIDNKKNGIIVDNFNVEEWKNNINILLNDEEYRKTIIDNAKQKIEQEFTWNALADKFLEVFNKRLK